MAETNNFNLYKPSEGESGWAQALNNSFDIIDSQMKSNQESISGHTGTGTNKHSASQIRTADGSNIETKIANLDTAKANTNHSHTNYALSNHTHDQYALQSDLEQVNNTLDLLLPDLSKVELEVNITNRTAGIRIVCSTNPIINITNWKVEVLKNSVVLFESLSSSSYCFVHEDAIPDIEDGDSLIIKVTAISGNSLKSKEYAHEFKHIGSHVENRLTVLESQLTIGNIIDSFAQDSDALQALANVLHSSNTLAQKVAELNR